VQPPNASLERSAAVPKNVTREKRANEHDPAPGPLRSMANARWRQRLRESSACCGWVTGRSWTRTRTRATRNHPQRREQQLQGKSGCEDEGEREVLRVGLGGSEALTCTGPEERRVDALGLSSGVPQAGWAHVLFPRFFSRSVGGCCCKCNTICARGGGVGLREPGARVLGVGCLAQRLQRGIYRSADIYRSEIRLLL
jgi:hypothetical protein